MTKIDFDNLMFILSYAFSGVVVYILFLKFGIWEKYGDIFNINHTIRMETSTRCVLGLCFALATALLFFISFMILGFVVPMISK